MKKIIILLLFLSSFILAKYEKVYVALDPRGDINSKDTLSVILVAIAKKGAKFKFPKIKNIGKYNIIGKPKGSLSYSIEQKGEKKVPLTKRTLTVKIKPIKSFDMPSFSIFINKKEFKSVPFRVKVKDKVSEKKGTKKQKKQQKKDKIKSSIVKKDTDKIEKKSKVKESNSSKNSSEKSIVKTKTVKQEHKKIESKPIIKESNNTKNIVQESEVKKNISKEEPKKSKKIIDYIFKMSSNKKIVVEGEPFIVTVKLIEPIELSGSKLEYNPPIFKGFKVTQLGEGKTIENKESVTRVIDYLLTSNKSTTYVIKPATANLEVDLTSTQESPFAFFGNQQHIKKLTTNPLKIVVNPKPNGVDLVGKFLIKNSVDKLSVKANKPFNYIIIVHGYGDLDNFELPEFKIPGLTIYNKDSKLEHKIEDGKLVTSYIKKFVFISDKDFIIPPVKLKVYDPTTKKVNIIKTKPYKVKVTHPRSIVSTLSSTQEVIKADKITESIAKIYSEKNHTKVKKDEDFLKTQMLLFDKNYYKKKYAKEYYPLTTVIGALVLGIILGVGGFILIPSLFRIKNSTNREKLFKSYEEALNILYPHTTKDKDIEAMVERLYEVTNGNKDIKIDEYSLKKMLKRVKESNY